MEEIIIYTAGATKSSPGAAAVAVRVCDGAGKVVFEDSTVIGNATDTYAAFAAVAFGLEAAATHFGDQTTDLKATLKLGNEEIKKQLNSELPVTNPGIVPHFISIHNLCVAHFPKLTIELLSKGEQPALLKLVTKTLDGK